MKGFIKKIDKINFGLLSPEDIRAMSVVTVETPDTYEDDGFPIEKGLMDPRMGVVDSSLVCRTCGFRGGECQGHFGSIELARPVIHIGFGDIIHKILRSTCNECGRVLLNDEQIEYFTNEIRKTLGNKESLNNILKEVYRVAKRELKSFPEDLDEEIDMKYCCPHCGMPQEAISLDKPVTLRQGDYKLTPSEVRERLERITDEDAFVLGVNPEVARPEWLVLTVLPVPPVTIRPSITLDTGERSEDDLTHKLVDILRINQRLLENMEAGAPQLIVDDLWELLQYHVTTYFDNEASGVPPARHRSGRPLITLMQRLEGHEKDKMHDKSRGRFREHLSGKRVNFSGRTVISPDPNISINQVGVPLMLARELTVPVYVTQWNIEELKQYILNGLNRYPGANYVTRNDGRKVKLRDDNSIGSVLEQLEPGFIIERHLVDGDIVLLNRHPSLHKLSMLAHEVKVLPYKTFRLNPAVCPPYNADFDGDEMNIHVLQNTESIAEAKALMLVEDNIISPKDGKPIVGAIRDHISGAYLLTRTGTDFSEEEAFQIINKAGLTFPIFSMGHWILKFDSRFGEESYIYKQKGERWTGKELFSLTLPNDLNMLFYAEISKSSHVEPPEDAIVVIKDGILIQGVIDEAAFGSNKGNVLYKIFNDYGPKQARHFLEKAIKLSLATIMKIGITNSCNDYEIPREAHDEINDYLNMKFLEVDELVEYYDKGYMNALPGRNLEETLDIRISQVLNDARNVAGGIAEDYFSLPSENLPFSSLGYNSSVMAHTGDKSSMLNITQISACVGPQSIRGQSISNVFKDRGYKDRVFPHFKRNELNPKSNGFIKSSFLKGLDPIEYFLHAMSGRDTLVDKRVRTAQSGYMQRRLVHALQDFRTDKQGVVKDAQGNVLQTLYGEDGIEPAKSDFGRSIDLNRLIVEMRLENSDNDNGDLDDMFNETLSDDELKKLKVRSDYLSNKLKITIKHYSGFIMVIKSIMDRINIEYDDEDLKQMINQLMLTHDNLIDYQKYCNEYNLLDFVSEKINEADNEFNIKKTVINRKLHEIKRLEYEMIDSKLQEYNELSINAESILDTKSAIFLDLNSRLDKFNVKSIEISEYIDNEEFLKKLRKIKFEFDRQSENLDMIKSSLDDRNLDSFTTVPQADNNIRYITRSIDELNRINIKYFEKNVNELEENYQDILTLNDRIKSGNVEKLMTEFENCFNRPMFRRQLKKYNLQDSELAMVKNDIQNDIINQVIVDEDANFKEIIKTRCSEFRKNNSSLDENEIDDLLNTVTFSEVDDEIVNECKNKAKQDFLKGNITINQVELKLNNYVNKKINESNQLNELERIKNNPNVPSIKIYLTQEETNRIYIITENEILSEYGIRGKVENRVHFLINKKIRENQSEARNRLNIIKRDFSNLTQLNKKEQDEFIHKIEFLINTNDIKYYQITEEYMIELSDDFINYGEIRLR